MEQYRKDAHYHITVTVVAEIAIEPMTETTVIGEVNNPKDHIVGVLDPASFKNGIGTEEIYYLKDKIRVRVGNPTSRMKVKLSSLIHLGMLVKILQCVREDFGMNIRVDNDGAVVRSMESEK